MRKGICRETVVSAAILASGLALSGLSTLVRAEAGTEYKAGDRVEVDVAMASSPANARWRKATVVRIETWGGRVSGISLKTDDGNELVTSSAYLRAPTPTPEPVAAPAKPAVVAAKTATQSIPATANADSGACRLGGRVVDREARRGQVVEARGADCRVKLDDGTSRYYLSWMLQAEAANENAEAAASLPRGTYACVAGAGVAGTLKLSIKNDSQYVDGYGQAGEYRFDAATRKIVFRTGAWQGFHGSMLGAGKIGLSSRPGGFASTICDLKR